MTGLRVRSDRLYLSITLTEGIAAFIWAFAERSMQRNAVLFGFSLFRIALGVFMLTILIFLAGLTVKAYKDHPSMANFHDRMDQFASKPGRILAIFTFLGISLIIILLLLIVVPRVGLITTTFLSPGFDDLLSTIIAVIKRMQPVLLWALLFTLQSAAFLWFRFQAKCREPGFFSMKQVYYHILTVLVLPVTLFHWAILYYQMHVFVAIPHWFWKFYVKPSIHDWLFIPLSLITLLIAVLVLWHPEKTRRNLILLLVTGYLLQVGFACIEDLGFERLRINFMQTGHHGYAQFAVQGISLVDLISGYEAIARTDPFFMTKPPGVISFYVVMDRLSSFLVNSQAHPPELLAEARYQSLTLVMSYTFPLVAVLVLVTLYALCRRLLKEGNPNAPGLLFICVPSFILTPLYLDQALYPSFSSSLS